MNARRWLGDALALARPVALYWMSLALGMVALSISVWVTQDTFDLKDLWVLAAIGGVSFGSVAFGQVVSISRVRSSIALFALFIAFWGGIYIAATYEDVIEAVLGEWGGILVILTVVLGPMMASGGFWSLRVNRGLAAAWAPSLLFMLAILIVAEDNGDDAAWKQGNKYAIWSVGTAAILGLAVLTQILFMAARERHRLHRWQTAPAAAELVHAARDPFRPLAGCGSFVALTALVLVLTLGSAVLAPYLWRTGPADTDEDGWREGSEGETPDDGDDGSGGGLGQQAQRIGRYMRQGVSVACSLLTMVVLAVALLAVFGPPTRRQLLLSHLRDPMWPVPPSRRARLHWRLAEIALGDGGVHRQPGETARDVALRGVAAYPEVNLEALVTAAEIADRVNYGYALDPADADTIRRAAEMTYHAIWESLGELERVKATYRFL